MRERNLFWRLYDEELTWREQLSSAIGIPVGLATILGGLIALYLRTSGGWQSPLGWWFGIAVIAALACFIAAVISLVRARHGYEYERVPYPKDIHRYYVALREYHASADTLDLLEDEFAEWLDEKLVAAADRNVRNNLEKSRHLYWAMNWIIATLVAVGLASPPYLMNTVAEARAPVRVDVAALDSLLERLSDDRIRELSVSVSALIDSVRDASIPDTIVRSEPGQTDPSG